MAVRDEFLARLAVRGAVLPGDIAELVTDAKVSYSADQVTQLTVELENPGWGVMHRGVLTSKAAMDYQHLKLKVASLRIHGGASGMGGVTVEARSEAVQALKERRGPLVMSNASPTDFVAAECRAVGLTNVVAEDTAKRPQVARDVPDPQSAGGGAGAEAPSSWTTIRRLAEEVGFLVFEWEDVVVFARPSWLVGTQRLGPIVYVGWGPGTRPEHELQVAPECRWSIDSGEVTVSLTLPPERQRECRPGKALNLGGAPGFDGVYMIESVDWNPLLNLGVNVSCVIPIDPVPRPPQAEGGAGGGGGGGTTVVAAGAGTYGGRRLDTEQVGHAFTIARVAFDRGLGARAALLGIMCALQESGLRNLNHGDRDSLGLFQQRPSQGWGSPAQVRDPVYAAGKFYDALVRVGGWEGLAPTVAIQRVQRSAFPDAYAKHQGVAQALLDAMVRTAPSSPAVTTVGGAGGSTSRQVNDFVNLCLAQAGKTYIFGAEASPRDPSPRAFDCSELIEWALARIGVRFPDGSSNQRAAMRKISVQQAINTRGALLWRQGHIGVSLGDGRTIEARNRVYGVNIGKASQIRWAEGGLVPGLSY